MESTPNPITTNALKINDPNLARMPPENLVTGFTRTPLMRFAFIAVIAHFIVIGATSVPFIYYDLINPEAGIAREERLAEERKAKMDEKLAAAAGDEKKDDAGEEGTTAGGGDGEGETDGEAKTDGEAGDGEKPKSRVEQRVEEVAGPDERPSLEDMLGDDNP